MIAYLKKVIEEFPELIKGKAPTPSVNHLFKIRDKKESKPLEEERGESTCVSSHGSAIAIYGNTSK